MEQSQPTGAVLSYSYDKAGNKTSATVTHQGKTETTTYLYDTLNRLSKVIDPQGGETLYAYDAVGNRESVTQANGQTTAYVYDALNRLTRQTTTDAADNVIADYRYTLHSTGRREQIEELHNGRVSTYTYDALYRLTHDVISDPVNGDYSAEYRFDKVGNRIYSIIDGVHTAYSYDDNDRLTQQGGVTYSYDANGNTLTETEDGLVTARYTYSAKNKLLAVTKAGETTSFGYNPDGIRTRKAGSGSTTDFIVDQNRDYAQVLQEDVNGAKQVSYVYGDDLLSQARAGDVSYYVYDGQGSVRSLTNQTGVQTDNYHYDAFGILLHSEGDTPNSYLYTGEQYDASLDQYYLRARYYDQNQGRFTQMDTWMGVNSDPVTLHKYLYANGDPIGHTDPTGNFSLGGLSVGLRMSISAPINLLGMSIILSNGNSLSHLEEKPERAASRLSLGLAQFKVKQCRLFKDDKCNAGIPILIYGAQLGELTQHVYDAQMYGKTPVLSKLVEEHSRTWLQKRPECDGNSPTVHCDEYPFAISEQGGEENYNRGGVSLRLINGSNNCAGGACLKHFFKKCGVDANDQFKKWFGVIADPGLPIKREYVCTKD
ncbi:Rhs family protein [Hahella chejuensis KCTC 2396]|uniref:Rhs family protein n=1 Tax=Hahella chejuensis (strain KCTC 2396) TaxID=349521 RepID=Q2SKB3_HAHCH|nr:Rhs family protein [Hahella chejuensis KCTC 2396]